MRLSFPFAAVLAVLLAFAGLAMPPRASSQAAGAPLDQMIGQMLMFGFEGVSTDAPGVRRVRQLAAEGKIGGIILMDSNIRSPAQTRALVSFIRSGLAGSPLFVAVDQEGGVVQRLSARKGFHNYPTAGAIGSRYTPEQAGQIYRKMAHELAVAGFNMNFGPVVDLNLNKANPIIARLGRSYGSDPQKVTDYARAFIDAHRAYGIATAVKHFPGHGSSWGDSHKEFIDLSKTWKDIELAPYRNLAAAGAMDMVMIGHLYHPAFSGPKRLPATLSREAVDGWVRGKLGFGGVIVTDDMEMAAVKSHHTVNAAAIMAVNSGNDIILYSNAGRDPLFADKLIAAIRTAVEKGEIPRQRIEGAYQRILRLKGQMKVAAIDLPDPGPVGALPAPAVPAAAMAAPPAPARRAPSAAPEPEYRPGFFRRQYNRLFN